MVDLQLTPPEGFLGEEVRCGYTVTKQMKEVWAIELDLLKQFDIICEKHGLHYCVAAGTLLGAIRHGGFIPWDDDIDVYMLRNDYNKLMMLANEFKSPYFLQNSLTEKNFLRSHAQLRNSYTTGCPVSEQYCQINRGLFIDIFPLDGISNDPKKDKIQKWKNQLYYGLLKRYNDAKSTRRACGIRDQIKMLLKRFVFTTIIRDKVKLYKKFEKNITRYSNMESMMWGNRTLSFECPKSRRPYSDWQQIIRIPFEFIDVPVPVNYKDILKQQYGDYMKIPQNKKGSLHGDLIISTDFSFDDPRRI